MNIVHDLIPGNGNAPCTYHLHLLHHPDKKFAKGAANLKVHLIVQNFCMHFNFEFWRKNSKLRCMQNLKNKLYLEMTIPFLPTASLPDLGRS